MRVYVSALSLSATLQCADPKTGQTMGKSDVIAKYGNTNGIKLERFMFDTFATIPLGRMAVLEVVRTEKIIVVTCSY
jgi:hypothetical protein